MTPKWKMFVSGGFYVQVDLGGQTVCAFIGPTAACVWKSPDSNPNCYRVDAQPPCIETNVD